MNRLTDIFHQAKEFFTPNRQNSPKSVVFAKPNKPLHRKVATSSNTPRMLSPKWNRVQTSSSSKQDFIENQHKKWIREMNLKQQKDTYS